MAISFFQNPYQKLQEEMGLSLPLNKSPKTNLEVPQNQKPTTDSVFVKSDDVSDQNPGSSSVRSSGLTSSRTANAAVPAVSSGQVALLKVMGNILQAVNKKPKPQTLEQKAHQALDVVGHLFGELQPAKARVSMQFNKTHFNPHGNTWTSTNPQTPTMNFAQDAEINVGFTLKPNEDGEVEFQLAEKTTVSDLSAGIYRLGNGGMMVGKRFNFLAYGGEAGLSVYGKECEAGHICLVRGPSSTFDFLGHSPITSMIETTPLGLIYTKFKDGEIIDPRDATPLPAVPLVDFSKLFNPELSDIM